MILLDIQEPNQQENKIAIGIDLGTTNSLVAYSVNQKPMIIGEIIPSKITCSNIILSSVKRFMGKNISDYDKQSLLAKYVSTSNSGIVFDLGPSRITPIEASAEILKKLKTQAEDHFGHKISQAVITVPAYFDEQARADTKHAASLAGLQVLRLLNEPTAAALAYGVDKYTEGTYLIYDFGGGTFDVSLLKINNGTFQVLATGGDANLGGDDIDYLIAERLKSQGSEDYSDKTALYAKARKIKEELSVSELVSNITRKEFDNLIAPILDKTIKIVFNVLRDAEILPDQISGVILVGGTTRIPLVQTKLNQYFPNKCLCDINPDQVVALGAALQAENLTQGSENLLIDVTPLSLGIETYGGLNEIIIHRNSPIPTSVSKEFTTYQDGQTAMQFHIVQGERDLVADCRSLAKFELTNIPPMKAGVARIQVIFTIDADGLLAVSAQELSTKTSQSIEIRPTHGLNFEQIEAMLLASMKNAESDIAKRLLTESTVKAKQLIESIDIAFSEDHDLVTAEELSKVNKQKKLLETAIFSNNRDQIETNFEMLENSIKNFADRKMSKYIKAALAGKKISEF